MNFIKNTSSDLKYPLELLDANHSGSPTIWQGYQKTAFRIAFIFFVLMSIPTEDWYAKTWAIDWLHPHYRDIYLIARFMPNYVGTHFNVGWMGYQTMFIILGIALVGGLAWSLLDRKRTNYTVLYYWLRVIVRYRACTYLLVWGMIKMFPVQMPYPSLGILNTNLGDLGIQKIYWWSVGIAPWYEFFAGLVEFSAGFLLFFRRTVAFGAAMVLGTMVTLTVANIQYDGHVHVESTYFAICGVFLLAYYTGDIYNLLIRQVYTVPSHYVPVFRQGLQYVRLAAKGLIVAVFIVLMTALSYRNFRYDPYNQPITASPADLRGYFTVKEFQVNNQSIPLSALHPTRWEDVTFEDWTTMNIKVFQPLKLDLPKNSGNIGFTFNSGAPMRDIDRNLEAFTSGSRRVFHYYADTVNRVLYLEDKANGVRHHHLPGSIDKTTLLYSPDWIPKEVRPLLNDEYSHVLPGAHSTRRYRAYQQPYPADSTRNRMVLYYQFLDSNHLALRGVAETNDSIYVVLERTERKYILEEGKLKAGTY
jgi:hypothetical protein